MKPVVAEMVARSSHVLPQSYRGYRRCGLSSIGRVKCANLLQHLPGGNTFLYSPKEETTCRSIAIGAAGRSRTGLPLDISISG